MGYFKSVVRAIGLSLLFLVSCTISNPTPSQTEDAKESILLTPTSSVACEVECIVDTIGYEINITCESGMTTVTFNDSASFEGQTMTLQLDQSRIYENSGNEYKIVGYIIVDESANKVEYEITVTGGVFGDSPQICEE